MFHEDLLNRGLARVDGSSVQALATPKDLQGQDAWIEGTHCPRLKVPVHQHDAGLRIGRPGPLVSQGAGPLGDLVGVATHKEARVRDTVFHRGL